MSLANTNIAPILKEGSNITLTTDGQVITIDASGGSGGGLKSGTAAGTDTYTVTITGVTSYTAGDAYVIKFTNGNTGASTLNINSIGAVALKKIVSTALASGDITSGQEFLIVYDGTNFQVIPAGYLTSANIEDAINDGVTTKAPSENAVFDALALKVSTTGNETVAGIKTFSSFPVTPSSAPSTDYEVANKKYVDDAIVSQSEYTNYMATTYHLNYF